MTSNIDNSKQQDQDGLSQHHRESSRFVAMDEEEYFILDSLMKEAGGVDTTSSDINPVSINSRNALCSSLTMTCDFQAFFTACMAAKDEYKDHCSAADNSEQGSNKKTQISPHESSQGTETSRNNANEKRKLSATEKSENGDPSIIIKKLKTEVLKLKREINNLKSAMSNRDTPQKYILPPNRNMARQVSEECSAEVCNECKRCAAAKSIINKGKWTDEEHTLFLQGLELYGRGKWASIASLVKTRTHLQIRTHAQKHFQKLASMAEGKLRPYY